jgi:hypothetical protein
MHKNLIPLFLLILLAACNNNAKPSVEDIKEDSTEITSEPTPAIPQMEIVFPDLNQYLGSQDPSFNPSSFQAGEPVEKDSAMLAMDTALFRKYKPYLLFNADSTLALDLVSYNYYPQVKNGKTVMSEIGPDFEVSMLYLKPKKQQRLLFFGSSGGTVLDAKWQDATTVLIAGAIDWENGDSLRPVIWKFDATGNTWQEFRYPEMIKAAWHLYPKKDYELNRR